MARWFARPPLRAPALLLACASAVVLLMRGTAEPEPARPADLSLRDARSNGEELDRAVAQMRARFAAKQKAAAELLDGRITPRQAVLRFREIGSSARVDPAQLTDETLLNDVFIHAELLLRDRPDAAVESALAELRRRARMGE